MRPRIGCAGSALEQHLARELLGARGVSELEPALGRAQASVHRAVVGAQRQALTLVAIANRQGRREAEIELALRERQRAEDRVRQRRLTVRERALDRRAHFVTMHRGSAHEPQRRQARAPNVTREQRLREQRAQRRHVTRAAQHEHVEQREGLLPPPARREQLGQRERRRRRLGRRLARRAERSLRRREIASIAREARAQEQEGLRVGVAREPFLEQALREREVGHERRGLGLAREEVAIDHAAARELVLADRRAVVPALHRELGAHEVLVAARRHPRPAPSLSADRSIDAGRHPADAARERAREQHRGERREADPSRTRGRLHRRHGPVARHMRWHCMSEPMLHMTLICEIAPSSRGQPIVYAEPWPMTLPP
jgi:hypothetical protein